MIYKYNRSGIFHAVVIVFLFYIYRVIEYEAFKKNYFSSVEKSPHSFHWNLKFNHGK